MSLCPRCEHRPIHPGHGELCLVCLKSDLRHVGADRADDVPLTVKNGNWRTPIKTESDNS